MLKIILRTVFLCFLIFACEPSDSYNEEVVGEANDDLLNKTSAKASSIPSNHYGVYILTKVGANLSGIKKYLSTTSSGDKVDLYHIDDGSNRQKWNFIFQGYDSNNRPYYHIEIAGGVHTNRKYLSTVYNGGKVDLYHIDDGSGRQRWYVNNHSFPFGWNSISAVDGVNPQREYLSRTSNRSKVDLFELESTTQNQLWIISTDPNGNGGSIYFD